MKDRFDLESDINNLWAIQDSLKLLTENVIENNLNTDDIANVLLGLETLLSLHIERLNDTFCQAFRLNQYHTLEVDKEKTFQEIGQSITDYLYRDDSKDSKKKLTDTINSVKITKTTKTTKKKTAKKSVKKKK